VAEHLDQRRPAAIVDLAQRRLHVRVPGRVAEQHLPGERMRLHVPRPGVDRVRQPDLGRLVAEQMLVPEVDELGGVALEESPVQVLLGLEMVVDDRRRDARAARDLVDRRPAVAALREHLRRRALDDLAARLGGQAAARGLLPV
jgi:hypothetical protein